MKWLPRNMHQVRNERKRYLQFSTQVTLEQARSERSRRDKDKQRNFCFEFVDVCCPCVFQKGYQAELAVLKKAEMKIVKRLTTFQLPLLCSHQ